MSSLSVTATSQPDEPSPASWEERREHWYAYQSAVDKGEKLSPKDEHYHRWPRKDRVNWVACQLRGVEHELSECEDEARRGALERLRDDYRIWLLKEHSGFSWTQIADRLAEASGVSEHDRWRVEQANVDKARRARDRVERSHPGSALYKPEPLRLDICPNCGCLLS